MDNEFVKCDSLFVSEQRDQEEVRRRFASITYSDPLHWAPPGAEGKNNSQMLPVGGDSAPTD